MEQSNVRLLNEIFALNTRLTEAMLQASELRYVLCWINDMN